MPRFARPTRAAIKTSIGMFAPLSINPRPHEIENRDRLPDGQPTLQFADIINDTEAALDVVRHQ